MFQTTSFISIRCCAFINKKYHCIPWTFPYRMYISEMWNNFRNIREKKIRALYHKRKSTFLWECKNNDSFLFDKNCYFILWTLLLKYMYVLYMKVNGTTSRTCGKKYLQVAPCTKHGVSCSTISPILVYLLVYLQSDVPKLLQDTFPK